MVMRDFISAFPNHIGDALKIAENISINWDRRRK